MGLDAKLQTYSGCSDQGFKSLFGLGGGMPFRVKLNRAHTRQPDPDHSQSLHLTVQSY